MNMKEQIETLTIKYGAIELSRFYLRGARTALASIRNGVETNNFALAAKDVGLLNQYLSALEMIFGGDKNTLEQLQQLDKNVK